MREKQNSSEARRYPTHIFTRDKSFYRNLLVLAAPIVLQNIITFLHSFADNIMVGRLGEYAISSVYIANQVQVMLQLVMVGFTSAMVIIATQYWGQKDTGSMRHIVMTALRFCTVLGLILTVVTALAPAQILGLFTSDKPIVGGAVSYIRFTCWSYVFFCISQVLISAMRSVEQAKIGMYISLAVLLVNVLLNNAFIFGKFGFSPMGIRGAALATLIARILEMLLITTFVFLADRKLGLRLKNLAACNKVLQKDYIRHGTPVVLGQVVWAVNILMQAGIIGRLSAEAIASVSIANTLQNMLFMAVLGLNVALGIITGKTVGAGEYEKMKSYAVTAQAIFILTGIATGIIIYFCRGAFIGLYNVGESTSAIANQFLVIIAIASAGRCYQATCLGGLVKAGGDVHFVFVNDTIFVFGIVIPSALIALMNNAPAWVVFACLQSDQVLKCYVALVKINRFKWMKKLTQ